MLRSRCSVVFFFFFSFFFTFLQDACALPTLIRRQQEHGFDFSKYTVPLSDGPSSLPPPSPTLALKAITLARGYQNYTCNPTTTTAPTAAGALATLYDATPLLSLLCPSQPQQQPQQQPPSTTQPQAVLNFLTHYLYYFAFPTFLTSPSSSSQHENKNENDNAKHRDGDGGDDGAAKTSSGGGFRIPIVGQHFFDAAHVPTWDLGRAQLGVLKGKKVGGIAGAEKGSVDWLVLDRVDGGYDGGEGSGPLKEVYRVETVGGAVGGECEGKGEGETVRVRYAAQYWFYG